MKKQTAVATFCAGTALSILALFFCIWQLCEYGPTDTSIMLTVISSVFLIASSGCWLKTAVEKE